MLTVQQNCFNVPMTLWTWVLQGESSVLPCLSPLLEPLSIFHSGKSKHHTLSPIPATTIGHGIFLSLGHWVSAGSRGLDHFLLSFEVFHSAWLTTIGSFPVWSYSLLVQNSNKNVNVFKIQFTPLWTFSSARWKARYRLNTMVQPITGAQRLLMV